MGRLSTLKLDESSFTGETTPSAKHTHMDNNKSCRIKFKSATASSRVTTSVVHGNLQCVAVMEKCVKHALLLY